MRKLVVWSLIVAGISGCTMATTGGYGDNVLRNGSNTYTINGYRRFILPTKSSHAYLIIVGAKRPVKVKARSEHSVDLGAYQLESEGFEHTSLVVVIGDGSKVPIDIKYNGRVVIMVGEDAAPWLGIVNGRKTLREYIDKGKLVFVVAAKADSVKVIDPQGNVIDSGKNILAFEAKSSGKYRYIISADGDVALLTFKFDF